MGAAWVANGFCVLNSRRPQRKCIPHRSRRNCPGTGHLTSSFQRKARVGFAALGEVSFFRRREDPMYCEHCGLQIMPQKPVCTRCGVSPTYHWMQLMGLLVLLLALLVNGLVAWFLLPRMAANHPGYRFF